MIVLLIDQGLYIASAISFRFNAVFAELNTVNR